jgi:hypothetical protein
MGESRKPGRARKKSRAAAEPGARGLALVTGASAGIGRELAREFASHGFDLAVVARRAEALEELAADLRAEHGRAVHVLPCDLLEADAPQRLFDRVEQCGLAVDVLVNNAGVVEFGSFADTPPDALERVVELNTRVLVALTRRFLPPMRARGSGRILNVASVAAFLTMPSMAVYAATKVFVLSFSEALSEELAGTGVSVTVLCPGLTATELAEKVRSSSERAALIPDFLMSSAHDVARAGYDACMAGRVVEVPGLGNRILTDWSHFQPRWLLRTFGGLVGRRFL